MPLVAPHHHTHVQPLPDAGGVAVWLSSARHFSRHWHDVHGVGVLLAGGQVSASGCGPVDATAGDIITTNPGEVHDGRPIDHQGRQWAMLYLEPAALTSLAGWPDDAAAQLAFTRPVLRDDALRQHLLTLFRLLPGTSGTRPTPHAAPTPTQALALDAALTLVATHLCTAHTTQHRPTAPACADVQTVCDRLLADPWHAPSLHELAQPLGISRYQLLRRFTDVHGLPPHAWLRMQRLAQARRLILRGTPLADVAAACGFADQGHMNRLFAAHYGHTPGQLKPR